ncbi:hypothetical protein [Cryptosporangium arvum]|uniref:hypothetical protein n=1 Tax=Cryptosporangium arvum TaxID=80871 RepID=UPI0004B57BE4|nr:hypothetical protein [Cryptosporangium arvum]
MRLWKVIGLAGLAGVAATGVAVARAERRRRAYTPEEIRARLHLRIEEASGADDVPAGPGGSGPAPEPASRGREAYRTVTGRLRALRDRATEASGPRPGQLDALRERVVRGGGHDAGRRPGRHRGSR